MFQRQAKWISNEASCIFAVQVNNCKCIYTYILLLLATLALQKRELVSYLALNNSTTRTAYLASRMGKNNANKKKLTNAVSSELEGFRRPK